MIKFSIIIPVYNVIKYLRPCLDSILAQTERDWECVCVDDGSTDGSAAILDEYADRDSRFLVVHQSNAGVSVARNNGMERANGEYICFVDADDTVEEGWLTQYSVISEMVHVDIIRSRIRGSNKSAIPVPEDQLKGWIWNSLILDGYPWSCAIRRKLALKAKFPDGVCMCEDELYYMRLAKYIRSAAQLDGCLYSYAVRQGTAASRPLKSPERLLYFQNMLQVVTNDPNVDRNRVSEKCSGKIMGWLFRPAEFEKKKEIRNVWRDLRNLGCAKISAAARTHRIPYAVYAYTGLIWPVRLWFWLRRVANI